MEVKSIAQINEELKNISSVELGYLDGVTSAIQGQINSKAPINSPTFTGTPTAPTPAAGDNSTKVATTAFVKTNSESNSIGVGQTWQNVTGSRVAGATYTNTSGKSIMVIVDTGSTMSDVGITVDGVNITRQRNASSNVAYPLVFIVPNYSVYSAVSTSITAWHELR